MSQSTEPGDDDIVVDALDALVEDVSQTPGLDSQEVEMTLDLAAEHEDNGDLPVPTVLPRPLPPPKSQWQAPEAGSVRAPPPAPPSSHQRSLHRQTSASFTRLTRQAAGPTTDANSATSTTPLPTPKGKAKARRQPSSSVASPASSPMGPPQPAPQSAMPSQSDSQVVLSPPVPAPLAATLRSNQLGADVTGKTNIPALRHDMLELTHHLDRLTRTHATDRAAIRDALLKLTMAVDDLRNDASPATSPTVAFRDLEQRVHRLAQGLEREEDTRAREIGVMDVRLGSVEDDTRDISRSVTTVSQELAGAISALSQIRATLSTITQQVGDLSNNARALVAAPAPTRETALTPSTPHESRRRERQVSPSPAPTQAFQRRLPRPPQPIPTDGHGAEGRPPKRARGNGQRGQHQPQLAPVPAPLPAPVAGPASFTVRFGAVGWSADPASLRAEVLSTGHLAWNAIPNVFESVMDIRRDPVDSRFALLRFPTRYLASTFVEAWVQHGHREQSLRTVHAVIL